MPWASNAAHVTGKGNLMLGAELDDGAGDSVHGYAKGDIWVPIPLNKVTVSGSGNTFSRASAGVWQLAAATAATAVTWSFDIDQLPFRRFSGAPGGASPHGWKLLDVVVYWIVGSTNASASSVTFTTTTFADNVTLPAGVTTTFGTIAYENPIGTSVAAPPVTARAAGYLWRAIPGTTANPTANAIFLNTDNTKVNVEIAATTGATTGTITISYIGVHAALALY